MKIMKFFSQLNASGGEDDKKPPKGFEKFFKKKEERDKEASATSKGKSRTFLAIIY